MATGGSMAMILPTPARRPMASILSLYDPGRVVRKPAHRTFTAASGKTQLQRAMNAAVSANREVVSLNG